MRSEPGASRHPASFRDPEAYVFEHGGNFYRCLQASYQPAYNRLMESGLYAALESERLIQPHSEADTASFAIRDGYKVLRCTPIPFISYPYEWCFGQLKDAALATLAIQKHAVKHGLTLKDASAYNIQFTGVLPRLIDTGSFEMYDPTQPWKAYQQFCRHFLAPLTLMAKRSPWAGQLSRSFLDGIPLDVATELVGAKNFTSPSRFIHLYLHAKSIRSWGDGKPASSQRGGFSLIRMQGLLDMLEAAIRKLYLKTSPSEWGDYQGSDSYTNEAEAHKQEAVRRFTSTCSPRSIWDMGANKGTYSRISSGLGINTVAMDKDFFAVEQHYVALKREGASHVLPLLMDLSNPSPAQGWNHAERMSLKERGPAEMVMALALIHHLRIGNNVPMDMLAGYFAGITARHLILEFVPKSDPQVKRLLASRADVFADYDQPSFERAFGAFFSINERVSLHGSERTVYLLERKAAD